ncbi:hypothetical protein [Krasilnikovia sp. MM14-A1004]|uniref:hypothetical protein n=1 Tax=Krasilnikovia sp. MM14-A1004 TaxID=3373541 RepID=UPI00399D3BFE
MRLSPKSIFFGVLLLGLPFALAVGWALGTPAAGPAPVSAPAGSGVLGTAPSRTVTPESVTALEWTPRPVRSTPPRRTARRAAASATESRSPSPGRVEPSRTPPPTPADPSEPPPSPSAPPPPSTDTGPAGVGAGELVAGS